MTPAPPAKQRSGLVETTRFLLLLFVIAVLLRSFFVAAFSIPSGSMLPRMMIGDYLFVAKWPYGYSRYSFPFDLLSFDGRILGTPPERGDVVVFRYPGSEQDYVKRLIGLPGDMIQVRQGQLYINGEAVERTRIADFPMPVSPNSPCRFVDPSRKREVQGEDGETLCAYPRYRETLPGGKSYDVIDQADSLADTTEVFMVPEGHVFVMGDNRDDSLDSRFPVSQGGVGMLRQENLIGRGLITFFSTDGSAEWAKPWTWVSAARWDRIGETY
ncbi:signal peptidase I [Allosphingosinicella flava]|uniref:Signal peptidase I n=1 Tax=Allosphingosinicella flava TaxID=2771430 RepID=A0A7T2GLU7_9SPHN|nr:signal peptidase I [Sphingosinicella flava]